MRQLKESEWKQVSSLYVHLRDMPATARLSALDQLRERAVYNATILRLAKARLARPLALDRDRVGERIGSCVLHERLGSGGMGTVYRAFQDVGTTQREVAVKLIHPRLLMDRHPEARHRFQQEINTLAKLEHARIVRLYEAGVYTDPTSGEIIPFFAMQLIQNGLPITAYANRYRLTTLERLDLFHQVGEAVAFAHTHHIVHRDLKPSNILVDQCGVAYVLDFGLALTPEANRATRPHIAVSGTPAYMSPEQLLGTLGDVGEQSDVYALGVILYELLTSRLPYLLPVDASVSEMGQVMSAHSVPPLRGLIPHAHRELQDIVMMALAMDPLHRFANVNAMLNAVKRHMQQQAREQTAWTDIGFREAKAQSGRRWGVEAKKRKRTGGVSRLAAPFSNGLEKNPMSFRFDAGITLFPIRGAIARCLGHSTLSWLCAKGRLGARSCHPPASEKGGHMSKALTRASDLLVDYLKAEGVSTVFGIPGGPIMPLYEALFKEGDLLPILAKHEAGAAYMASGYARIRGELGVCCATTGPGATNALTGLACASRDSILVLLLTAQVAIEAFGKGAAQESSSYFTDTVSLYQPITKASYMLPAANKMADTIQLALRQALTGRRGPVHISLPANLMRQQVRNDPLSATQYRTPVRPSCDRSAIRQAVDCLMRSRRPAILAGHGVYLSQAWPALRQLAEQLGLPVATTPKAKGIFPEDHPLSLGVFGFAGSPQADAYLLADDVDVLFVVGSSLGETATHCWSDKLIPQEALIQLDIDTNELGKNYPITMGLVGDADAILTEMVNQLPTVFPDDEEMAKRERERALQGLKQTTSRVVSETPAAKPGALLHPQQVIQELQDALPDNALFFTDIGNVMAWALHFMEVTQPGSFHINLGLASMGYAVAASIGAKCAAPDRPVVALVGDAAFAMHGMEVHTAVESNLPVVWLVMNNHGHGMVRHGERIQFKDAFTSGMFQHRLSIAGLAQAMGAQAVEVTQPGKTAEALRQALQSERPTVLDVHIDPEAMPPLQSRMETLERFFAAE